MTKNNDMLLEMIETHRIHPTADEIFTIARQSNPKISLGTVYRNLNELVDSGKIRRVSIPGEADRFDCTIPHDHLKCRVCRKIFDINIIECHVRNLPEGLIVESYTATAYGICAECAKHQTESR